MDVKDAEKMYNITSETNAMKTEGDGFWWIFSS